MLAGIAAVNAQLRFKSIDNEGNATTIVLVDDETSSEHFSIGSPVFNNCGEKIPAKSANVSRNDGKTTVTLRFRRCTEFDNTSVTLEVNGKTETVKLNLGGVIR